MCSNVEQRGKAIDGCDHHHPNHKIVHFPDRETSYPSTSGLEADNCRSTKGDCEKRSLFPLRILADLTRKRLSSFHLLGLYCSFLPAFFALWFYYSGLDLFGILKLSPHKQGGSHIETQSLVSLSLPLSKHSYRLLTIGLGRSHRHYQAVH